jgi:4-hydroxybenzoyl-CoA thioesterase
MAYAKNILPLSIEWAHCDPAGIVWNPRFFEFFDTASWTLFQTVLGLPRATINAHFGILGLALAESGANFIAPLAFGDQAEIESEITEFRRSSFTVAHRIRKDGKLAVDGIEKRVWAVPHPDDPLRMTTKPIPDEVIDRFRR